MDNFDFKTKYLKYKTKYISLKNNNQAGGERHDNMIRKDGNVVTYPQGFPDLSSNGDYHVVHAYDQGVSANRNKLSKIEILQTWVNQTFPQAGQPPADQGEHIGKTWNVYNSAVKQDFIDLVNWLNDPSDD